MSDEPTPDVPDAPDAPDAPGPDEPAPLPIDGILDLHTFAPRDVKELVPVWLDECRAAGIRNVRIIHGKGIGVLREIVHEILARHPDVEDFGHPSDGASWGATVARLRD